jgi:methionine-rich copper-binding protein CopC
VVARSGGTIELMTDYGFGHQSVEVFSVSDAARVTINGNVVTIDPTSALLPSTGYHLGFNNALADNAGNAFSYTHGQYNFTTSAAPDTTAPTASTFSPADEATAVAIGANVVVTFSEAIQRGAGSIVLKKADGTTVASYAQSSTEVTVSGNVLTINPASDLSFSTGYKVEFAAGAVQDVTGNNYAGTTSYNFTTGSATNSTAPNVKFWKNNALTPSEIKKTEAVNLSDAIAILKMIVGLNVNSINVPLSPYQAIAADFDQNGAVELSDAIGVLKMVVGLNAPSPAWKYFDDEQLTLAYSASQSLTPKSWTTTSAWPTSASPATAW